MKDPITVRVRDFSKTPGPRKIVEGQFSGELFRTTILAPAARRARDEGRGLFVDLDGVHGYGTSFIEESFGGLIRDDGFSEEKLLKMIKLKSEEEDHWPHKIREYWKAAEAAESQA